MWFNGHHKLEVMNAGNDSEENPSAAFYNMLCIVLIQEHAPGPWFLLHSKCQKITWIGPEWSKYFGQNILGIINILQSNTRPITAIKPVSSMGSFLTGYNSCWTIAAIG